MILMLLHSGRQESNDKHEVEVVTEVEEEEEF